MSNETNETQRSALEMLHDVQRVIDQVSEITTQTTTAVQLPTPFAEDVRAWAAWGGLTLDEMVYRILSDWRDDIEAHLEHMGSEGETHG